MFVYLLLARNRAMAVSKMHVFTWTLAPALQPIVPQVKGESKSSSVNLIVG